MKVVDGATNEPVPNVQILDKGKSIMMTTDIDGNADVSEFSGKDSIYFRHVSFKPRQFAVKRPGTTQYTVKMEMRTLVHEEFVVGASRFRESRDDIPQTIETISSKAIAFESSQTTADLLENSPAVFVQKSQMGGGSPILRGLEANKVLLVVDGLRMNNAIYRSGHLQNVLSVDQGVLERAEVVQGPGSVVYGSEALGGVIHMRTRDPKLLGDSKKKILFKNNTFTRFSSVNNELTGHIDFSLGWKKFGSLTSVTYSDFKDLRMGNVGNPFSDDLTRDEFHVERINNVDSMILNEDRNIQDQSGYEQIDALQKFIFKPSNKVTHRLNIQFSTTSNVPRYDRLQEKVGDDPKYAEWNYGPQNRILTSYSFSIADSKKMYDYVNFVVGYQRINESRHSRRFDSNTRRSQLEDVDVAGMNLDFSKGAGKHLIRYGIETNFNYVWSTASDENINTGIETPTETRYPSGGTSVYSGAAYLSHSWSIAPLIKMQEGIRYNFNHLQSDFGSSAILDFDGKAFTLNNSAVNGSLGFVFTPAKGLNVNLLGATGFRAPNLDDLGKGFELDGDDIQIPNTSLKPTYLYSGELSINKRWKNGSYFGLVGYYSHLTDAIVRTAATYLGEDSVNIDGEMLRVYSNQNKQNAFITGASAQVGIQVFEGLAFTSSVTYTYGRILGDSLSPLDHIPPLFGRLGFLFKKKRLRAEVFSNWSDWKRLANYNLNGSDNFNTATPSGMPAWFTLNTRVSYRIGKTLTIQLGLENILDQNYRKFGSDISAPGRNFTATLRAKI
ncbi:MAG: hemoglobin/transferrin/lactoferrin receptor protein [Granulosicoccus sp.]